METLTGLNRRTCVRCTLVTLGSSVTDLILTFTPSSLTVVVDVVGRRLLLPNCEFFKYSRARVKVREPVLKVSCVVVVVVVVDNGGKVSVLVGACVTTVLVEVRGRDRLP